MFKEEIKALAAEQVAERRARTEKKASTPQEEKVPPARVSYDSWQKFWAAWNQKDAYWMWFIGSTARKEHRRAQIRIRHLIAAYVAGVPYNVLEKKSHVPVYDLACGMIIVMRALGVSHSMDDVYAWIGADMSKKHYQQYGCFHSARCLGIPEPENVGASMA